MDMSLLSKIKDSAEVAGLSLLLEPSLVLEQLQATLLFSSLNSNLLIVQLKTMGAVEA